MGLIKPTPRKSPQSKYTNKRETLPSKYPVRESRKATIQTRQKTHVIKMKLHLRQRNHILKGINREKYFKMSIKSTNDYLTIEMQ